MKCRLTEDREGVDGPLPKGTEIEHPHAFRLVELGHAEPADEECAAVIEASAARRAGYRERLLQENLAKAEQDKAARAERRAAREAERQAAFEARLMEGV